MREPNAHRPAPGTSAPDGAALFTWINFGLAGVIALCAAALYAQGPKPLASAPVQAQAMPDQVVAQAPASTPPPLADSEPNNITRLLLDAEARAHEWKREAALTRIVTVLGPDGPKGALEFEFGIPKGPSVPGTALEPVRLTVSYADGKASSRTRMETELGHAVNGPGCPLEVALRGLGPATRTGTVAALYSYWKKGGRPIWLFTEPSGAVHRLDGDSCAQLRR
jgi:hypothetical protein